MMLFRKTKAEMLKRADTFNNLTEDAITFGYETRQQLFQKTESLRSELILKVDEAVVQTKKMTTFIAILGGLVLINLVVLTIAVIVMM